jgi:hypothetical protein
MGSLVVVERRFSLGIKVIDLFPSCHTLSQSCW